MANKVSFEGKRELRWREIGHCLVSYMEAETEFADELWDDWMEAMRRPGIKSLMICSWGPTQPSHQQWRRATRLMRERKLSVAVVTDARHNMALAKAASWLGTNIESQRWNDLGKACEFAGFDHERKIMTQATIIALRDRFGAVVESAEVGGVGGVGGVREVRKVVSAPRDQWPRFSPSSGQVYESNQAIQQKLEEVRARFERHPLNGPRD